MATSAELRRLLAVVLFVPWIYIFNGEKALWRERERERERETQRSITIIRRCHVSLVPPSAHDPQNCSSRYHRAGGDPEFPHLADPVQKFASHRKRRKKRIVRSGRAERQLRPQPPEHGRQRGRRSGRQPGTEPEKRRDSFAGNPDGHGRRPAPGQSRTLRLRRHVGTQRL